MTSVDNECKINYGIEKTKYYSRVFIINRGDCFRFFPDIDYCCDEMNDFFNKHDDLSIELSNPEKPQVDMTFVSDLGWYGDNEKATVIIRYCPFCGAKINLTNLKHKNKI